MHPVDWIILIATLAGISLYGVWQTRGKQNMETYLMGNHQLRWWTIGLSVMATQASAITFLSTTGQGYEAGLGFAQFYIGLPVAMVILSAFFLPLYYRLHVYTAYEYLETRFDLRTRAFTATLFLLSRGMAAGFTIYAPGIVLSTLLGWDLTATVVILGFFVVTYTAFGGSDAVSITQQQQMIVILTGMVVAFIVMVYKLPPDLSVGDAFRVAGKLGKTKVIDFKLDWNNRYNFWSGMIGGTFLFLSYFGTDQSQVQRYISGRSLTEGRLGLLFNGIIKVPMQFLVLIVGVMMFIFYQFIQSPIHFNTENIRKIERAGYRPAYDGLQKTYDGVFNEKKIAVRVLADALRQDNEPDVQAKKDAVLGLQVKEKALRDSVKALVKKADPKAETNDRDYVFITFVIHHLPVGVVGLLLAVIFSAAMSSKSSELNALATSSVIDFYRRSFRPHETDAHYMLVSKWMTAFWGVFSIGFALSAQLFENLIEAVNIIGSLFYGAILGVFLCAFFLKYIHSKAVFWAAVLSETLVVAVFVHWGLGNKNFPYLWLNLLGCILVTSIASILQFIFREAPKPEPPPQLIS